MMNTENTSAILTKFYDWYNEPIEVSPDNDPIKTRLRSYDLYAGIFRFMVGEQRDIISAIELVEKWLKAAFEEGMKRASQNK